MFDGHAGVDAAMYAKCHLLSNIVRHPLFTKDVTKAIGEGIIITDKNFCTKAEEEVCICSNLMVVYTVKMINLVIPIVLFIVCRICVVVLQPWLAW